MKQKINIESPFYQLGQVLASPENLEDLENAIYDPVHIDYQKKFASALASLFDVSPDTRNSIAKTHLAKVASTKPEDWNDFCEDTILHCIDVLEDNAIEPKQFAKIAATAIRMASLPVALTSKSVGLGLPILGALGGGLSWIAEKELSEDDANAELLKQDIHQYRRLALALEKQLRKQYGYKTPEELEEEKAVEDTYEALQEKERSED